MNADRGMATTARSLIRANRLGRIDRMPDDVTIVFGVPVPSADPVFLAVVRFHILVGITSSWPAWLPCSATSAGAVIRRWNALLLVPGGGCRFSDRLVYGALGRELSPVHSRHSVLDCSDCRSVSYAAALAQLGQTAYCRHGPVIHCDADRILCGQRQEPATLERASSNCVLVVACCDRDTDSCASTDEAPIGAARIQRAKPRNDELMDLLLQTLFLDKRPPAFDLFGDKTRQPR